MAKHYISPAMLPLEQIAEYMDKVEKFAKKTDKAKDTENVAGIASEQIAVSIDNKDRGTVKNATQLGGIDAANYVTTKGAEVLLADAHQISVNSGDEIKNLRDELYQIKGELAKAGMIKNTDCYNGYIDPFKEGHEKYISEVITITSTDSSSVQTNFISVEDASDFKIGEYLVVSANNMNQIAKIQDIVGTRITFTKSITGPIENGAEIYKTCGSYSEGAFVFGKKKDIAVAAQERYVILNDDAQPLLLTKKYTPNSGYAAQINIPTSARGAIKKVGVKAKLTGTPGALRCYVIDPTSNTQDVFTMATIEQMKEEGKIIGESSLLYPSQATQSFNELYFEFPKIVVLDKPNYLFLFVQIDADTKNFWELKGLRGEANMDLQTNSKLYSFSDGSLLKPEDGDLYIIMVTSEVLLNKIEYLKQGLYTNKVVLTDLTEATRVRVELKINREGRFKVVQDPNTLVPGPNAPLNTYNEDNKSYPTSMFNVGQLIAVGNHLAKVGSSRTDNTSFSLEQETYAPINASVYRIGYSVQAKAYKKVFDKTNPLKPIKVEDAIVFDLPLIAIVPGKEAGKENISSDRLIFEAEIKLEKDSAYILKAFNEIETQVYWENNGATSTDLNNYPELAGKILDITVSTDNTYNTIKK